MRLWPACLLALLLLPMPGYVSAAAPASEKPTIDKVDPPNWWTALPDPMLVVHGTHLDHARFSISVPAVNVLDIQPSANGHWAIITLKNTDGAAHILHITAANAAGEANARFEIAKREENPEAHPGFSSRDVMYLIMLDRFAQGDPAHTASAAERQAPRGWHGGDLAGITQHISYLKQLGVTAVWTTPVVSNGAMPHSYHGYAATDLYAIDAHFGTLADYRRLSDALHAQGIKLVIDLVPNHVGVQHPWVQDPPAPGWLHGTLQHHPRIEYDFYQLVDPHAPHSAWSDITSGWFTDAMPDLNQQNPLVARYLIQNAMWWIETANLDGIRLDTFPYVDRSFWSQFHETLHKYYPHLTTVGEVMISDPEVTSFFAGGLAHRGIDTGLDTPFDYPVFFALRDVLAHEKPMTELARVLRQDALYPHPERLVTFIGNHDTTRFVTDASDSSSRLKMAHGLVATLRGMPQLYAGDEIAMEGKEDPDNRRDFPGGFRGDPHNAFTHEGRTPRQQEVFEWTSSLLKLRAAHTVLQTGLEQNLFSDQDHFVFLRTPAFTACSGQPGDERILVLLNKAKEVKQVDLPTRETALEGCTRFLPLQPAAGDPIQASAGALHVSQPAESLLVYAVD